VEKLTLAEKIARNTLKPSRETVRGLDEIRAEIADALTGIDLMRENLKMAVDGIKQKGMYILSRATNNKGEVVVTERLNPAFRVQREAMSAIKGLRRALVLLREEEQLAIQKTAAPSNEFEGL
jgi:hypothetical protein